MSQHNTNNVVCSSGTADITFKNQPAELVKTFTPPAPALTTGGVGKVRLKGYHSLSSGPGSPKINTQPFLGRSTSPFRAESVRRKGGRGEGEAKN